MKNRIFILATLVLGVLTVSSTQAAPVPFFGDPGLQECVDEHVGQNNWQEAEEFEFLVCDNRGITDISGIDQLINLNRVSLAENLITDINPLGMATQLTSLNLSGNGGINVNQLFPVLINNPGLSELGLADIVIEDLHLLPLHDGGTGQPLNLTRLDISNTGINEIDRLTEFPNLRFLNISANDVNDLWALHNLMFLEELNLAHTDANNLDVLNGHNQLVYLNLAGNRNVDFMMVLPILQNNPNLRTLNLSGIAIPDPGFLMLNDPNTGMPYPFEELYLANTGISDIGFMAFYPELKVVDISNNRVSDVTVLNSLSSLTHLDISNNNVNHVSLYNVTTLTTLRLSGNSNLDISDLYEIIDLNQDLTRLGLGGIVIDDLFQLPAMYNYNTGQPYPLIELDISNTGISDIFRLQEFATLQHLDISDNAISDLSPLSQLLDLRILDGDNNRISDISPLSSLTHLTSLKLSDNIEIDEYQLYPVLTNNAGITELGLGDIAIDYLHTLPLSNQYTGQPYALTYLDISNTGVTDITVLNQFPTLRHLDVSHNALEYLDSLELLIQLEELNLEQAGLRNHDINLLNRHTKLTHLNVAGNQHIEFMSLLLILQNNFNLQSLNLTGVTIPDPSFLMLNDPYTGQPYPLTELRLSSTDISNINFLPSYSDLQILDISNNRIDNISDLNDLHNLTELNISDNDISDLTSLFNLTSLKILRVSGNNGISINDLYTIIDVNQGLTHLGLADIAIGDLAQLPAMFNHNTGQPYPLIELNISNTGISDVYRLQEFSTLQHLNISDNNISDLSPLSQLLDLRSLNADNNQITDITPLDNLTRLSSLKLSGNSGIDATQLYPILSNNPELTELGLGDIAIGNLFSLPLYNHQTGQPYALSYLDISNTGTNDAYGLDQFPNLRYLDISDNPVENLYSLQYLTQLEELNLGQIQLNDDEIDLLNGYTKLTRLDLAGNRNIEFMQLLPILQNNPNLQALDLTGIAIPNSHDLMLWDSVSGQPYPLTELHLAGTGISDIDFLYFYPNLKILDISNNNISDITELNDLHSVTELNISYNRIQNVTPLSDVTSLTTLYVSGNPIFNLNELYSIIDSNQSLTRLGLADIVIGNLFQLPAMFNHNTGQPYPLIELDISNTGISDLFRLQEFPTLQHLDISDNNISDLSPLSQLLDLRSLDADNNHITDVTSVDNLARLTSLKLSGNSGIDANQLHPMLSNNPGLTELGLGDIAIGDLLSLPLYNYHTGQPYALTYLNISNTGATDTYGLDQFPLLRYLDISDNNLEHLAVLENLPLLEQLNVGRVQSVIVDFLDNHTRLTHLNLAGSRNVDFTTLMPVLQNNPNLRALNLNGIQIHDPYLLALVDPNNNWQPYSIEELHISDTSISNIDFLNFYPNLKVLDISRNNISDITVLNDLHVLTQLDISHNRIVNVSALNGTTTLTTLRVSGNSNINLGELYAIIDQNLELTRIGLGGVAIGNLFQLPPMYNYNTGQPYPLIELDVSNTGISNLVRLQEFPTLQHIDISDNNITNLSPVSQLLDLRSLDVSNNQITDIAPLGNLTRLTSLNLSGNSGISLSQLHSTLSNNPALMELGLGDIAIGNLNPLPLYNHQTGQPYNLTYLDVSNTGISNLDRIAEFQNLRYLNASQNNLFHVIELHELFKLEKINLNENQISNIDFLAGLSELTDLRLAGNSGINFSDLLIVLQNNPLLNVLDVSGISIPDANLLLLVDPATGLPYRFNELYLSNTGINQVDFLWVYPDLRVLDISGNSLNDLSTIPLLPGLIVLNVSHNQIENLDFLTQLPGLLSVDLSNNDIKDINPLLPLTQLVNLNLFGNNEIPCPDLDLLLSHFPFGTVIPPAECFNGMAPELTLLSPMDGTTFTNIDSIPLEATANDVEDGVITENITWSSDLDGTIATGNGQNVALSVGTHILTATITDSDGNSSSGTTTVIVQQPQYCDAAGISSTHDWIEEFSIGDYTSTTGNNNGYANFTSNEPIPIARGDSIVTVLPAGNAFYNRESWRIWIDLDRDGEFSTGEIVFTGRSTKYFSKTISLPSSTSPGLTVMRVAMKYGSFPTPCEVFPWGEVEDYRVNIQ